MSEIDSDIKNWDIHDIFELFGLVNPTKKQIIDVSNKMMAETTSAEIKTFLGEAQNKAIKWHSANNIDNHNRVTVADQASHFQMNRETQGVKQTYTTPVTQGSINPNQINTTERMVIIDSQYRPSIIPYSSRDIYSPSFNTNFSVDLSDALHNVLSMELYSIQIPQTWYNISATQGNNSFTYITSGGEIYHCTIDDGYYNVPGEWSDPSSKIVNVGDTGIVISFIYDITSMKIKMSVTSSSEGDKIIWHSDTQITTDHTSSYCSGVSFINNNLGWSLGFRNINETTGDLETPITNDAFTIYANSACSLYGPQYLLLSIDDYQHNRLNKAIIGTIDTAKKLDMPSYNDSQTRTNDPDGNCIATMTAPRRLTQAQLYTINTIQQNRLQKKQRNAAPTTNNVLAIIPIEPRKTTTNSDQTKIFSIPTPIVAFGDTIKSNSREYFGPVNIERLGIKLVDDKGTLIDLNGADWSFTIKVKQLYQY